MCKRAIISFQEHPIVLMLFDFIHRLSLSRRISISSTTKLKRSIATVTMTVNTTSRLSALRTLMKSHKIQAYIIPSEDQHSSEYLAQCDERRAFISGFNGSAGCAVVTMDKAYMFTDGRYFLQAEQQLDECVYQYSLP